MKIDAFLYVLVAVFGAVTAGLGSDEAAKYISPAALFYARFVAQCVAAGALALKLYRSTAFADNRDAQKASAQQTQIQNMDATKAP